MNMIRKNVRRGFKTLISLAGALGISLTLQSQALSAEARNITIGTGSATGVYYPVGQAICEFINLREKQHGMHCSAVITSGSVDNINRLRAGTLDFAIAQSDVQFYATKGYGPFNDQGAFSKLYAVLALHPEFFTVIARADAGIRSFDDLKGKRVNIGPVGSGQRTDMNLVMHVKGWTVKDFALASALSPAAQSAALCKGEVDAVIYTVGHPNESVKEATNLCETVLVPVQGPAVQALIEKYPYLSPVTIPGEMYPGTPHDTKTFGVTATLVSTSDTPNKVVYKLVNSVFKNFDDFKSSHAALFGLEPDAKGLWAPMHPGVVLYYQE